MINVTEYCNSSFTLVKKSIIKVIRSDVNSLVALLIKVYFFRTFINCLPVIVKNVIDPIGIYIFKVNNRNTRTRCEICSKLTIKNQINTPPGVFIGNFEHISHLVLLFLFLTLSR